MRLSDNGRISACPSVYFVVVCVLMGKMRFALNRHLAIEARKTATDAMRDSLLPRAADRTCEACAEPATDAHHDDYALPLVIRYLCRAHHFVWHHPDAEPIPKRIAPFRSVFLNFYLSVADIDAMPNSYRKPK